jgi:hypothetical protein
MTEQKKYPYKKIDHLMSLLNKNNDCTKNKLSKPITDLEFEQFKKYGEDLIKSLNLYKNKTINLEKNNG